MGRGKGERLRIGKVVRGQIWGGGKGTKIGERGKRISLGEGGKG